MAVSARWLLAIFCLALALRLGVCVGRGTLGVSPQARYREYVTAGQRLLEHGTIISPLIIEDVDRRPSAMMPPAYVGLVAAIYGVLGVESFAATLALQVINALATSLVVVFTYWLGAALAGPRGGFLSAVIAAINPTLIGYTDFIWDTSLFALSVSITVWMAMRIGDPPLSSLGKGGGGRWFGFGLWLGALALLNPALTPAYPFLVLLPMVRRGAWHWPRAGRQLVLVFAGWAIAIVPWTARNYAHFGEFVYIRSGFPVQLWLGVCPEADPGGADAFKAQFPLNNEDVQQHVAAIGERAFIQECAARSREAISQNRWRFVKLCFVRAVDYWAGTTFSHAARGSGSGSPRGQRAVTTGFLLAETALVIGSLVYLRRAGPDLGWLLAAMAAFSIVYCLTHVQLRFRAPVEPMMAVVVATLLCRVTSARQGRARVSAVS